MKRVKDQAEVEDRGWTFVWANEHGGLGMLPPEHYESLGFRRVRRHPFWPASWLMEKPPEAE